MGNDQSTDVNYITNHIIIIKFSPELEKKLIEVFNKIDTDHSGTIDK